MALIPYFEFNGKSTRDFGLTIGRDVEIGYPSKDKKIKDAIWSNKQYDFSKLYGGQKYTNRLLKFPLHILNKSESSVYFQNSKIINWLMASGRRPFYYSEIPGFYFMAEVVSDVEYDLQHVHDGVLEIVFECYPFMIDMLPEGHDLVAFMKIPFDVRQRTNFTYKSTWSSFKQLNIGDYATYGAWSTQYYDPNSSTGGGASISPQFHGYTYEIIDKISVAMSDRRPSRYAYKLAGHSGWLLEQDIVQAQTEYLEFVLVNPGITGVTPIITTSHKVTIMRDNEIYNLMPGTYGNGEFTLNPGINKMQAYIANVTLVLDFNFHKELI